MASPPTPALKELCRNAIPTILGLVEEGEGMLLKNRIFIDRLENIGSISKEDAVALSWTGPCLRSTGVAYDVRKAHPYLKYDEVDFDVPVGTKGDNLDRFLVRLGEIRQSARIILQACERMADDGPVNCDDPRVILPPKSDVYTTIEATIQHFKLVMEGAKVPAGECYSYTEGGNGELGFYLVSNGTGQPWRVRIRPPCFAITQGLSDLINGAMLSDIVPTFGSLNMIGGECDH
jgi:NADH-quinone oxidoreductase subunit D